LLEVAPMAFTSDVLTLDSTSATRAIVTALRGQVLDVLRRKGIVLGLSGGIDSSLVAALAARAVGTDRVLALLMPERDSSPSSLELGRLVADRFGLAVIVEDITASLEAMGCYADQDAAIRTVFPEYGHGWKCKLTIPSILESDRLNVFRLTVRAPDGAELTSRMPPSAYRRLVAATNMKQRVRKMIEYCHADRLAYAVAGTPNRLEYDQGFFVKQGDGAADVKPIAHLYKTQVYALAAALGVPSQVCSQEEPSFALPHQWMDLCLYAFNHGIPASEVAPVVGLETMQVTRVFRDIESKRRTTKYLHMPPLFVEKVEEIST
jgi:NAD+ synthase